MKRAIELLILCKSSLIPTAYHRRHHGQKNVGRVYINDVKSIDCRHQLRQPPSRQGRSSRANIGHSSSPFSRRAVPAAFERVVDYPAAGKARRLNKENYRNARLPLNHRPRTKSWQSRIAESTDAVAAKFVESISYDRRIYKQDIAGSMAHATMLAKVGLITDRRPRRDRSGGLKSIEHDIEAGTFVFDESLEDIHMVVEDALIKRIGEPGRKLHTGRSRNDQVALDLRLMLWIRETGPRVDCDGKLTQDLILSFVLLAETVLRPISSCPLLRICSALNQSSAGAEAHCMGRICLSGTKGGPAR